MGGRKGYAACKESFIADDVLMDEFDVDALRERFVKRSFNDRMEEALPLVQKAYNMKKSNNFAQQFESWADNVSEGTWAKPEGEEQVAELIDLLMEPLTVGIDATNATGALYNLVGDDNLFDRLSELAEDDPEADARDIVMDWLQTNMPEIYGQIMSAIGDEDTERDYEPDLDEGYDDEENDSSDAVQTAIIRRIINSHSDLLSQHGPEAITHAARDVAEWVGNVEEIGSSDVSAWVKEVINNLETALYSEGNATELDEATGALDAIVANNKEAVDYFIKHNELGYDLESDLHEYYYDRLSGSAQRDSDDIGEVAELFTDDLTDMGLMGNVDEAIGDDYVNKDEKMKRMGAKELSTLDKVKIMPSQMKAMAKGDDESDLTAYNKQFNEEIAQMRKIAGI